MQLYLEKQTRKNGGKPTISMTSTLMWAYCLYSIIRYKHLFSNLVRDQTSLFANATEIARWGN